MLDDLTIGLEVDLEPFLADMAVVDTVVANPPTVDLTPIADEFKAVTKSVTDTVVATSTLSGGKAVAALEDMQTSLADVSEAADQAQFSAAGLSRTFTAVSMASKPLTGLPLHLGAISAGAGHAATGAANVAAGFGLASTMATYMAAGLGVLLAPLRGLVIVPKLIAGAFSLMFAVVLAPFKAMAWAAVTTAKAMWALLQPVLKLSFAIFKLKVFFKSLAIQLKLLKAFFALLPPRIKLLVGGLIALGVASKVSGAAVHLAGKALGALAFAAMAVTDPLKAVGFAMLKTTITIGRFVAGVMRATKALGRFIVAKTLAGLKGLGTASLNVAKQIGGKLAGAVRSVGMALGLVVAAGAGWGIKLAADAEQAEIAFATMLKSGSAAKAVLAELEQFAASTPFQLNDLRDGAKQLLNAQVPASQLTDKLRFLGDIAAGTGKPITDFVRIFAKVKATGKTSLETLNQLAERGVPIYSALQQQLGVSREEMLKMISQGRVGFQDFNAALMSTATGAGVFAGGMMAQSQTISGLFSTLKDNVGFAMRELGGEIMHAFNFKGLMATGISMFQSLKAGIASMRPAFVATAGVVKAAFGAVWEIVTVTFDGITAALGLTGGNFMATFMEWAAVASWSFKEWPNIAQLAFTNVQLWLVQAGSAFVHFFTGTMPALFTWFGENWSSVFFTAFDLVTTIFINLGQNIRNAMTAIWDFIASGGTAPFEMAWVPLTEGFHNAISKMPDIPERAVGELEKRLAAESENLASALGGSLAAEIDANMAMLDEFQNREVKTPELPDTTADTDQTEGEDKKQTQSASITTSIDAGTSEALKTVFNALGNRDPVANRTANATEKTASGVSELNSTIQNTPVVRLEVAGAVG